MRARVIAVLLSFVLVALGQVPVALAQDQHDDTSTTFDTLPGAVGIGDGMSFTGAVITTPGDAKQRTLNAYQAAVFVQSWMPTAFFGGPSSLQAPPTELPISRIDITGTWGGPTGALTAYYASDGTKAWVSWPQDQLPSEPPLKPPPPSDWFIAPTPRAIEAFAGTAKLVPTLGTFTASSTTEAAAPAGGRSTGSSDSADSMPWGTVGLVASVVAAVIVIGGLTLRRRRA